jgi:peptide/nickel transport system substrate-binding protein
MKRFLVVLTLLVIVVLPTSSSAAAAPASGGPMTVGIAAEPAGLDPALFDFTDNRFQVTTQVIETLVNYAPGDSLPVAGLAESWAVSADGLTWIFNVRTGIVFHDGTPLNAAGVAFNLQRQWDPAHPYHNAAFDYFQFIFGGFKGDPNCRITDITTSGASQVQITLQDSFSPLPSILAAPWLAIASPTAVAAGMMDDHPVGTGPFRLAAWTPGDSIRLEANSGYWRGAPKIGPLTFKVIPNAADRLAALQANTIQVDADVPASQLPAAQSDGRLRVVYRPSGSTMYIGINRDATAPLGNPLVLQAVAHALNKPALVSGYITPGAQLATQFVPPSIWGRDPAIADISHDVALAQSLLTQAGYPSGFSTTLATRTYSWLPDPLAAANAIKADLAAAGIQVGVHVYDGATFNQKLNNGELELYLAGWGADYMHPANFLNDVVCLHWSWFGLRDEPLCQAMVRAEMATSFANQLAEYQWGSRRVHDTLPLIPLAHTRSIRVDRREVLGVLALPASWDDYATAAYAENWLHLPLVMR